MTTERGWHLFMMLAWLTALLFAARSFVVAGLGALRARRIDPRLAMALLLLAAAGGWCVMQTVRNVYEAEFELPLLMLACLLAFSADPDRAPGAWMTRLTALLAILVPISIAGVAAIYGPSMWRATRAEAYLDDQPFSVPLYGYRQAGPAIVATARLCAIPPDAANVLIDDATYFAMMRHPLPQHYIAVLLADTRGGISDPIAYLRGRKSGGAVLGCRHLPPDLLARARRNGAYCCLGPRDF